MGLPATPRPVLPLLVIFGQDERALEWARQQSQEAWGPPALVSQIFDFDETQYYRDAMGENLRKQLLAYQDWMDPADLVARKLQTNRWEAAYAREFPAPVLRPLNLDAGYLTEAKLVLATTKDRDHRIYLDRGILAECTLSFRKGSWHPHPWTYPDFAGPKYHPFLTACRDYLRQRLRGRSN